MKTNTQDESDRLNVGAQPNLAARCLASCRKFLAQLQSVKAGILAEFGGRIEEHERVLQLALNEAEALAWQTGFPELLFPTLATEKARAVATWHARQQSLRRTRSPLAVAA